jgi:hypothetical protein
VRFEVLVTVSVTNDVSCKASWRGSAEIYRRFGETCCRRLHVSLVVMLNVETAGSFEAVINLFRSTRIFLCFAARASRYKHCLSSVYSITMPLHVSGLLVVNHQEVKIKGIPITCL